MLSSNNMPASSTRMSTLGNQSRSQDGGIAANAKRTSTHLSTTGPAQSVNTTTVALIVLSINNESGTLAPILVTQADSPNTHGFQLNMNWVDGKFGDMDLALDFSLPCRQPSLISGDEEPHPHIASPLVTGSSGTFLDHTAMAVWRRTVE
jgi:hypothetical protein